MVSTKKRVDCHLNATKWRLDGISLTFWQSKTNKILKQFHQNNLIQIVPFSWKLIKVRSGRNANELSNEDFDHWLIIQHHDGRSSMHLLKKITMEMSNSFLESIFLTLLSGSLKHQPYHPVSIRINIDSIFLFWSQTSILYFGCAI